MLTSDTSVQSLFENRAISRRLYHVLLQNGFSDLQELAGYDVRRIRHLRGFGPATTAELRRLLPDAGIR